MPIDHLRTADGREEVGGKGAEEPAQAGEDARQPADPKGAGWPHGYRVATGKPTTNRPDSVRPKVSGVYICSIVAAGWA